MFERVVPPFLENIKMELSCPMGLHVNTKKGSEPLEDPSHDVLDWLLVEHFRTALLWHVVGKGQQPKP